MPLIVHVMSNLVCSIVLYGSIHATLFQIMYLRDFRHLKSLSLKGNSMCDTENFTEFVIAYLPNLVYYEYAMIEPQERQEARNVFS